MHRLASKKQALSRNLTFLEVPKSWGYIFRIHNLGSRGTSLPITTLMSSNTLFQKEIICGHSHIQWKSDPFTLLHLKHVSGILGLKWYNLAGVMYCLVSHLYCSNLECVFVVWVWAKEQAFDHSSCVIISFKSNFQACKILFEDSLHSFSNWLYYKDT